MEQHLYVLCKKVQRYGGGKLESENSYDSVFVQSIKWFRRVHFSDKTAIMDVQLLAK